MRYQKLHNAIPFPQALLAHAAKEAALDAASALNRARRDLSLPTPPRPVTQIHQDVLSTERVAVSLAQATAPVHVRRRLVLK